MPFHVDPTALRAADRLLSLGPGLASWHAAESPALRALSKAQRKLSSLLSTLLETSVAKDPSSSCLPATLSITRLCVWSLSGSRGVPGLAFSSLHSELLMCAHILCQGNRLQ